MFDIALSSSQRTAIARAHEQRGTVWSDGFRLIWGYVRAPLARKPHA